MCMVAVTPFLPQHHWLPVWWVLGGGVVCASSIILALHPKQQVEGVRWVIWACLSQPPPHWGSTSTCLPFSRCPSHYRCRTMGRPIDKSSHSISGTQLSQAKPKGIWTVAVPVLILHWHQPQVFLVDDELAGGSHPPVTCAPTLCSEYIQFSRTWTEERDLFKGHGPHETGTEVPDVSMALFVPQKPYCGS